MENFAELMQRLLEIQSGGRQRSLKLIKEDDRLMDRLRRRTLELRNMTIKAGEDGSERVRFKA